MHEFKLPGVHITTCLCVTMITFFDVHILNHSRFADFNLFHSKYVNMSQYNYFES